MSYASEPYAQFVDDLLMALTGGVIRQHFRYLKELEPFRIANPDPIIPSTLHVFGVADKTYRRFISPTDYNLVGDSTIQWQVRPDGTPLPDAVLPDEGTIFYANFESLSPAGAAPLLTDRNPGSITRLLAESFAREFAVVSRQLEDVYRSAFLDTAGGRDLEQLTMLVGVTRRQVTIASGAVLFGRSTPSPADIFIPAGTKLSTAEPPAVVFETTQNQTLRRGNLSVQAPVQAIVSGAGGVVAANAIRVIHRPILGIETVSNSQPTTFSGAAEDDETLRGRARRALAGAGQATTGALTAALATIPGLREKDIQIAEDPLAHPGVVKLTVALPPMDDDKLEAVATQAVELIEETRPVGVRIDHNIDAPRPIGEGSPGNGSAPDEGDAPVAVGTVKPKTMFMPVDVVVQIAPTTLSLTPQQRNDLIGTARKTVSDFLAEAGIGEILVYNRLIGRLMAIEGVLDVSLEMYPQANPDQPHHKNVVPDNPASRPSAGLISVEVGGALVMLDVVVTVNLKGAGLEGDANTQRGNALKQIEEQLRTRLKTEHIPLLSVNSLKKLLNASDSYDVVDLHYKVEYQEAGARIHQQDIQLPLTALEQLWVRRVSLQG
ncbi:MAG TPA: baseplate J/gp47 family protein [Pyrinomonadaceae bacterium]